MKRIAITIAAGLVPYAVAVFSTLSFSVVEFGIMGRCVLALASIWTADGAYLFSGSDK